MTETPTLRCDGQWTGCQGDGKAVTYIDAKGYAYCTPCGQYRQQYQACRKLRPHEQARLLRGERLASY